MRNACHRPPVRTAQKEEENMGIRIIAAVVCVLIARGLCAGLFRNGSGRAPRGTGQLRKELRHAREWVRMIVRG